MSLPEPANRSDDFFLKAESLNNLLVEYFSKSGMSFGEQFSIISYLFAEYLANSSLTEEEVSSYCERTVDRVMEYRGRVHK